MRNKLKTTLGLLAASAFALTSQTANANTITVGNIGQVLAGGGSDWTMDITFANSRLVAGDFFTIMDWGSASVVTAPFAPAGGSWVFSQALTGPSPYAAGTVTDNASLLNVTFTWTGNTVSVGDLSGGNWILHSPIANTTAQFHDYVSQDHADSGITQGLISRATGPLAGPATIQVPDGGSTLMLLGSVFAALGALRRKLIR